MNNHIRLSVAAAAALTVLAWANPALAHVTVNPSEAQQGGFAELMFRAPNEKDGADTTKVQVFFPTDHPIAFVSVRPTPGWQIKVDKQKLATPISSDDGQVTEAVSAITWTGDLKPGQYEDFGVSVGPLPDNTDQLVFKALQTYSDGDVVRWIELAGGGKEPEHPAPILTLTGAKSAASPSATASTAPSADPVAAKTASTSSSDVPARVFGIAGLVLGLAALVLVFLRGRRRTGE